MATISFVLGGIAFEYDDDKNKKNIKKHGVDFHSAARVFFDYDRIEMVDDLHSYTEERYNTIGDISTPDIASGRTVIGTPQFLKNSNDILFVVYTDRVRIMEDGSAIDVTRLISARFATEFERGLYYGKY